MLGILVLVMVGLAGTVWAEDPTQATVAAVQAAPIAAPEANTEDTVAARFVTACRAEFQRRNTVATEADCESLLLRSHLIQSDAIRYLAQASEVDRQAFAAASTLARFEILAADVDATGLVPILLEEREAPNSRMAVQLARDVMKSSCGFYQIEVILKTLDVAGALPQPPKSNARRPVQLAYKSCMTEVKPGGEISRCLNPIFQSAVTSAPSPNP